MAAHRRGHRLGHQSHFVTPVMRFLAMLFRNLSRHGALERDLDEEVRAHVELLVDEYRATGMVMPLHDGRHDWNSAGLSK